MAEAVRVGLANASDLAMMTEQGPETLGSHPGSPGGAFQVDENGGTAVGRTFQPKVMIQQLHGFGIQRQETDPAALASHTELGFGKDDVMQLQRQHFARAQPLEQHQSDDGQVTAGAEAAPKP